jgi:hypothetical protein
LVSPIKPAFDPNDRAYINDAPAALFHHNSRRGFRDKKGSLKIDVKHHIPVLFVHPDHQRISRNPGIVDDHVDRSKPIVGGVQQSCDIVGAGDIGGDSNRTMADFRRHRLDNRVVKIADDHRAASHGKPLGDRATDPPTGAGYDYNLPCKIHGTPRY